MTFGLETAANGRFHAARGAVTIKPGLLARSSDKEDSP
jgi:hypothetical protein